MWKIDFPAEVRSGRVVPIPPGTEKIMKPLRRDEQYFHQKERGRTPGTHGEILALKIRKLRRVDALDNINAIESCISGGYGR